MILFVLNGDSVSILGAMSSHIASANVNEVYTQQFDTSLFRFHSLLRVEKGRVVYVHSSNISNFILADDDDDNNKRGELNSCM